MKLAIAALLLLPAAATAQTPADPYRALGTEPFWGLTIDGRTMRLDRPDEQPRVVPAPVPRPTFNGRRYEARTMTVDVTVAPCSDGMSDRRYSERVTVTVGRQTLRGCGGAATGISVVGQQLEGRGWTIVAIDGRRVVLDGAELRFQGGTLAGSAGCNRLSASYRLSGETLRVGLVRATRMACAEPVMASENRVLAALAQPLRIRWVGRETVVLASRRGGLVLSRIRR